MELVIWPFPFFIQHGAGKVISNVIELRWGVELKTTRIYEILNELNLSYQKAHRDYANILAQDQTDKNKMTSQ